MMISPLHKLIITSVIWVSALGGCVYTFRYISDNVKRTQQTLYDIHLRIAAADAQRVNAVKATDVLANNREDIERMRNFFVSRETPIRFIERLEALARETKNTVTLIAEEGRNDQESLFFRVTFTGIEKSIRGILEILDAMPLYMNIENISFIQSGQAVDGSLAPASAQLIVSLRVKTL